MSQFDYPRIHFAGKAAINPGTANNNVLLPLVMYDPIQVKPVLPPRIYLSNDLLNLCKLGGLPIPENHALLKDENGQAYVEIEPVNTRDTFHAWAKTPLGKYDNDEAYHDLYDMVRTKRTNQPLTGQLPANWNFYGGMEFAFLDAVVQSVAVLDENQRPMLVSEDTPAPPPDLAQWLGASVDMNTDMGKSAAVMIDVVPTLALFSQVFCDAFRLHRSGNILMKGRPLKASLRFFNLHRVVNQEGVEAGSGSFVCTIPLEQLEGGEQSAMAAFFQKYSRSNKVLKGVFIRYNLFEVWENQTPDYGALGPNANPARATVAGTLAPWYEGELCSTTMGRQLVPENPFLGQKNLASLVCRVDTERKVVILDLLGSTPEIRSQHTSDATYETYPLGPLHLQIHQPGTVPAELGNVFIDEEHFSRKVLVQSGGLVEIPYPKNLPKELFETGELLLIGQSRATEKDAPAQVILMRESEFMVASDQAAMYTDQGVPPEVGCRSYSASPEPCIVRVFRRGKPFEGDVPMLVRELMITSPGASANFRTLLDTNSFRDGQQVLLPTDKAGNAMFVFFPGKPENIPPDVVSEIIRTGFYINLRVLPKHDFGKYLDPTHPEYPSKVTFEVLYREVLEVYDVVFPISSIITPFNESYFQKGKTFLKHRMSPDNWASYTYMPSSRDMSADQWSLVCKWAEQLEL